MATQSRALYGTLALLPLLVGCEQQIALRQWVPINSEDALVSTAAILDPEGTVVVVGVNRKFQWAQDTLDLPLSTSQGDFLSWSADSPDTGSLSSVGIGPLWRIEQSARNPGTLLALSGDESTGGRIRISTDGAKTWKAAAPPLSQNVRKAGGVRPFTFQSGPPA